MLVDGVDVRDVDRDDLWQRIGVRPPEGVPVQRHGRAATCASATSDATDEELWQALEIAQGATSSRRWTGGSRRRITQGGTNVSGGQRQRLAIARALVRKARRSSSSTTASRRSTSAPMRGCAPRSRGSSAGATVIIVAQRVGTIMNADRIVVMDGGRVVGIGTHRELLATTRPTARSSTRSCPRRRPRHERATRQAARPPAARPARARRRRRDPAAVPAAAARRHDGHGHGPAAGQAEGLPRLVPAAAWHACGRSAAARRWSSSLAVVSVTFAVIGPKILGEATNIIFEGAVSKQLPGRRDPGAGHRRPARARARPSSPTCSRR